MEMVQGIFKELGADVSILFQFGIFLLLYVVLRVLLFEKLKFVIENRDEKTVKQEAKANDLFKKAESLKNKYSEKMEVAYMNNHNFLNEEKRKISREESIKIKSVESDVDAYVQKSREEVIDELKGKKSELFKSADELANGLIDKMFN